MSDIPEHLVSAFTKTWTYQGIGPGITAVLAALRPEDAHLVPAWMNEKHDHLADMEAFAAPFQNERDEARAEVERLKAENELLRADLREYHRLGVPMPGDQ